jgi:hypothetical protein
MPPRSKLLLGMPHIDLLPTLIGKLQETCAKQLNDEAGTFSDSAVQVQYQRHALAIALRSLGHICSSDIDKVRMNTERIGRAVTHACGHQTQVMISGSLPKGTFVKGISDIDLLAIRKARTFTCISPRQLRHSILEALYAGISPARVTEDRFAAKVDAPPLSIHIVPCVYALSQVGFPVSECEWTPIRPHIFAARLYRRNEHLRGKLTTAIRLAKVILNNLGHYPRVSGCHIEALALMATARIVSHHDILSILSSILSFSARRIVEPTRDVTLQTRHVDAHLGKAFSQERRSLAAQIATVAEAISRSRAQSNYKPLQDLLLPLPVPQAPAADVEGAPHGRVC